MGQLSLVLTWCALLCGVWASFFEEQARVIHGRVAPIEKYPYTVDYSGCAGAVISERWVLSAAHCFDPTLRRAVRVGSARARRGTPIPVSRGVPHPQFKPRGYWGRYDFLLLELGVPLVFNTSVRAAPLYDDGETVAGGTTAQVAAFGRTAHNAEHNMTGSKFPIFVIPSAQKTMAVFVQSSRSRALLEGELVVLSAEECARQVRHFDPEVMLCARGADPAGSNVCKGDSGGALAVSGRLAGVVSWGDDECPVDAPAVFARVAAVRHWIRNVTRI